MATVNNTITLRNRMTPVLNRIMQTMSDTLRGMSSLNSATVTNQTATNNTTGALTKQQQVLQRAQELYSTMTHTNGNWQAALRQASKELRNLNNEAGRTPPLAERMRNSFSGIGQGIIVANQALQLFQAGFNFVDRQAEIADNFMLTKSRIENMGVPLQEVDGYMEKIKAVANETRGSFSDTAAAVAKLGTTAGQSFQNVDGTVNQDEILRFSQLMNKSFAVGGAGIQEQTAGMYQLTQAMAAGKLQGDEFRSITETAPLLAKAIADYTGRSMGDLKKMSSEGQITADIIKNALYASADTLEAKYANLPMTWAGAWQQVKNDALFYMKPVMEKFSQIVNSPQFKAFLNGVKEGFQILSDSVLWVFDAVQQATAFIANNWVVIQPVLIGIGIIISGILIPQIWAWASAALIAGARAAVGFLIANWQLLLIASAIAFTIYAFQNMGMIAQAVGIAIIIILVLVKLAAVGVSLPFLILIGIILAVAAGFLFFQDQAITVLGVIVGAIYWLGAVFYNVGAGIANGALAVAEFLVNVWNDAVYSVGMLWYNLKTGVLTIVSAIVKGTQGMINKVLDGINLLINGAISGINALIGLINNIPGVDIKEVGEVKLQTTGNWAEGIDYMIDRTQKPVKAAKAQLGRFDYKDLGASFEEGQQVGENLGKGAVSAINNFKNEAGNLMNSFLVSGDTGKESDNPLDNLNKAGQITPFDESMLGGDDKVKGGKLDEVGKIGEEVDISDTDLKYLKDIAQAEYVNKFTTLTPNMTVNISDVKETADVNAIAGAIEEMFVGAVHGALFTT